MVFSAGIRTLWSKIGGRTAANFLGQSFTFFARFCVILLNFRPVGNSDTKTKDTTCRDAKRKVT
jgi:hypothetical protein